MGNYIRAADLDVQGGLLSGQIEFQPGLNLLSGENGTLKTKALQSLKQGASIHQFDPGSPCRRQAISPKRNAQRRAFSQIFEQSRRKNLKLDALINERNINDAQFEEYPALGDLFYVVYDDLCKDGGNQVEKMEEAARQFNSVIERVFPHYRLIAQWNKASGSPAIELLKHGSIRVPLEGLSLGEQEILSLATSIYSSRERYDVFLIDEPEVHLNWHLEERLFEFLDDFCSEHSRQMVVVTHSRVVFSRRFFPKTQFLFWNELGRVSVANDVTPEQRRRIAGDAIVVIRLGEYEKSTFFVEDESQAIVVEVLAEVLGVEVAVAECANKSNVRSLHRLSVRDPSWSQSYFLEDGDNEGNPFEGADTFIHLEKYCIENYLLDLQVLSRVASASEDDVKTWILEAILESKSAIFRKNKFFEFLVEHLTIDHLTPENLSKLDASAILPAVTRRLGVNYRTFVQQYVKQCFESGRLDSVMPPDLLVALRASGPNDASASVESEDATK